MSVLAGHRVDPDDDSSRSGTSGTPANAARDDGSSDPHRSDPHRSDPHRSDPGAAPTRYAEAGYGDTEYADPQYADAQYADAQYGDPRYGDPQYGGTEYADPRYAEAGYADGDHADPDHGPGDDGAPPPSGPLRPEQLRADFGAHFEAHYQRLVAQLYAITLNPAEAHDVVREAYSRAWRRWAEVGASPDPAAWVRRVAVRSTMRSWRRVAARVLPGGRRLLADGGEPRTRAALLALGRLRDPERRAVVLVDMAGVPVVEVAALEQVPPGTVAARLSRGRRVVGDALAEAGTVVPASALGPRGRY